MLGIIGGTGLYKIDGFENVTSRKVETPYGSPSAEITIGSLSGQRVAFLPRHGTHHQILPSEINFRANIWALKAVGVREILSVSAVGSLREEIKPGDLAVPNQYLDFTKGKRNGTFFGSGIAAHISTAHPSCPNLSQRVLRHADSIGVSIHKQKTYVCVEGPRLGTRAESLFFRQTGCDLVGMTNVPEVFLAREAQLCYITVAVATDYDCWLEDPTQHASVERVIELYQRNIGRVQTLIKELIQTHEPAAAETRAEAPGGPEPETACGCRSALRHAVLTKEDAMSDEQRRTLAFLME